jgi:hypothetical protein
MRYFWPIVTGKTFFDGPSVFHLSFWIFMGSCFAYAKIPMKRAMAAMFIIAYAWEVFERFAEKKWPTVWLNPESWLNSYVSDPLTGVVGLLVAYYLVRHA